MQARPNAELVTPVFVDSWEPRAVITNPIPGTSDGLPYEGSFAVISKCDGRAARFDARRMLRMPDKEGHAVETTLEERIFVRSKAVVSRVVAGETLIVPVRGRVGDLASIYSFNETGSLIWKLLETPQTLAELVAAVAQEYNVERARAETDTKQFIGEMLAVGLVEASGSVAMPQAEGPVGREGLAAAGAR